MTSTMSSSEGKFFLNTLKRRWSAFLLFALVIFVCLTVPAMIVSQNTDYYISRGFSSLEIHELRVDAFVNIIIQNGFILAALSLMSIFAACTAFGFMHSKKSAYYYFALPIKREKLFAVNYFSMLIPLISAYVLNMGITLLIGIGNNLVNSSSIGAILLSFLQNSLYTILFFTFACLVGTFSGGKVIQFVLTFVFLYIIPLIYSSFFLLAGTFIPRLAVEYYMEFTQYLSPGISVWRDILTIVSGASLAWWEYILYSFYTLASFALALFIIKKRPAERAEVPVIFAPLGEIIKYLVLIPATILAGLFFYSLAETLFWFVFGCALAIILGFMLTNTILNKTAKAMFKHIRGIAVFAVIFALFAGLVYSDALNINKFVPKADDCSRISISLSGTDYSFNGKQEKEALVSIAKKARSSDNYDEYYDYYDSSRSYFYSPYNTSIVYHSFIPFAFNYSYEDKNQLKEEIKILLDSDEFETQYLKDRNYNQYYFSFDGEASKTAAEAFEILKDAYTGLDFEFFQRPCVGYVNFNIASPLNYQYEAFPLFYGDGSVADAIIKPASRKSGKVISDFLERIASITVTDKDSDKTLEFKNKEEIEIIISSCFSLNIYNGNFNLENRSFFSFADPKYYVDINFNEIDAQDIESYEDGKEIDKLYYSADNYLTAFILDKVPQLVKDSFK